MSPINCITTKDLLRYIPDNFLSTTQRQVRHEAIAETIKYTNAKNDKAYNDALEKGNIRKVNNIVEAAAKSAGYTIDGNQYAELGYDNDNAEYNANMKNSRKLLDSITYDDDGNIIPISERFNKNSTDERYMLPETDVYNDTQGGAKNDTVTDTEAEGSGEKTPLRSELNAKGKQYLDKVERKFGNSLAKLLPMLKDSVEGAVGIDCHDNRYYADNTTKYFYELPGGYIDGDSFIPVRFGIKEFKDGSCTLYVVVCQDKIKKARVTNIGVTALPGKPTSRRTFNISVSQIFKNVNNLASI